MNDEEFKRYGSIFPPINLSKLVLDVLAAVERLHEYEKIHGPVSKRGPKVGTKRAKKKGRKPNE